MSSGGYDLFIFITGGDGDADGDIDGDANDTGCSSSNGVVSGSYE